MTKKASILFAFMLIFQTITSGLGLTASATAEGAESNIFDGIVLTNEDGEIVQGDDLERGEEVGVNVEWSTAGQDVDADDTYQQALPDDIMIEEEQSGSLEADSDEIGTYTTSENRVIAVEFDEAIAEHPDAEGMFSVEGVFVGKESDEGSPEGNEGNKSTEGSKEKDSDGSDENISSKGPLDDNGRDSQVEINEDTDEKSSEEEKTGEAEEEDEKFTDEETSEDESVNANQNKERTIGTFAEVEENIFTFVSLTHDGNDIEDNSIIDGISDGSKVELKFDWDTKGLGIKNGDTASMQLPDVFEQVTTPDQPITTSGITVGNYSIQDGELIFKFNDKIEDGDVHNGKVGLNLNFDLEKFEENIEQVIDFNDSNNTTLNVIARPDKTASDITKEGHPDRDHNANEVTWTVDIINNSDETVSNATLNDTLPDGLGSPENLVIKSLSTSLHGDKIVGDPVDDFSGNITEGIEFDELKPFEGYRVEYTTPITNKGKTKFTNDASFFNGTKDLPADATVSGLTTSNPIEKSGEYNKNTGQIDWTIVANENGNNIDNVIIEDNLPAGLALDKGSLIVEKHIDGSSDGEIEIDPSKFPLKLGKTAANEHYEINFSTDIDYEVVNDGEYQKKNEFTNTAILKDGEDELGEDNATVEFDREPLLEKTGTSNVDYDNKTLTWTIDVNKANHPLNNLEITDIIPAGLGIEKDNINIIDQDGSDFAAESIDINPADDGQQEVVINLEDIGTKHLTIEYTTSIEDFNVNTFNNTVSMDGEGIGEGDHETSGTIKPSGNSFDKSFKSIDYNKKTMKWQLKVDPKREAITSLTIEDTFPNKGMILDPSTVKVKHSKDGNLTKGTDYTLEPRTEDSEKGYHKGFIIELSEDYLPLDGGSLTVDYTTSYDPEFEVNGNTLDPHVNTENDERVYENNAHYSGTTENGNGFNVDKDASTKVREDSWNSGKKEGQRVHENSEGAIEDGWESGSERKIAWQLYTNYQKQNLGKDLTITDTLQYEGKIDEGSIKVSTYSVDANGNTTITDDELDTSVYDVDVSGDKFTLTFDQEVSERYVVEFLTTVPDISQEKYTNKATVKVGDNDYPYSGTVDYKDYDDFLDKSAVGQEGSDVYIGDEIDWEVEVNDSLSVINEATITDTISAGLEYVDGTLEITSGDGDPLSEGTDYTLSKSKTEDGKTVLTIELDETLKQALTLKYKTVVTAEDGDTVSNEIALDGKNLEEKTITSEELTAEQFSWVEGEFNENRGALKIVKADSETEEAIADNFATFELYYDLNGERVQFGDEFETNEDGELLIGNLPLRTYYIQEVEAPAGYIIDEDEQEIDVSEAYGSDEKVYEIEFTNTKKKTDISVTKEWDDNNNQDGTRPDDVEVQLYADGEAIKEAKSLSENNSWQHIWEHLDEYHSNGDKINYTVQEVEVPEGYEPTTESEDENNIVITNTHEPETIDVSVSKRWEDKKDQDGIRPNNVTVNLLNDSEVEKESVLNEDNDWQHTFTDLPKFADGKEIKYSVTEDSVEHYSTEIETTNTDEGLNSVITNAYTPEKTSVTVTKGWDDADNQDGNRPDSIEVQLIANGKTVSETVTVSATDDWEYTWSDQDLYADGEEIEYSVEELNVPEEYTVTINDKNHGNIMITNSYTPETTGFPVTKTWDDADDQDGKRPEHIKLHLLNDRAEIVKTAVVQEQDGNEWQYTFTDIPKYENGKEIDYSITEDFVSDYTTTIEEDSKVDNGFVVTNAYTPEETSVKVTKGWNDGDNQDGNRPESIDVQLTADGDLVGDPVTISEDNNWTHTWDELDLYVDGEEINYSVEELSVLEEYTVTINDKNHGNIMITNSYTPEVTEVPVTKTWKDDNNPSGDRPRSIIVTFLSNSKISEKVVLSEANDWNYTFTNLPKYESGTEIEYSIIENDVDGYETTVKGFDITNLRVGKTDVAGEKTWLDNDSDERPEEINVQLLANGEQTDDIDDLKVTAESDWTYEFKDLPKYDDQGVEIDYTVKESDLKGYDEISEEDYDLTNLRIGKTQVTGTKTWLDEDSEVRPDEITVNLLRNGEKVDSQEVKSEDGWEYSFTDLDKYDDQGVQYGYTIDEEPVEGYKKSADGNDLINTRIGKTEVTGEKIWQDNDDATGDRPESITVNVLQNGDIFATEEVTAENDWKYTFKDLPRFDENGVEWGYTVDEVDVDGYAKSAGEDNNLINTRVGKTEISGEKTWNDADDSNRPESITVHLLQNGTIFATKEVTADDNWEYSFDNVPRFDDNGIEWGYTIDEEDVDGYKKSADGNDLINTRTGETTVTGEKIWKDNDDATEDRPDSITVTLLQNSEVFASEEVTAEDDWKYSFTHLPKFDEDGIPWGYTVDEKDVDGYEKSANGNDLINTRTGETTVTGEKIWNDNDDATSDRPDSITVNVLQNGKIFASEEVTAEDDWEYNFTNLPEFDEEGVAYGYTVDEEPIEGYKKSVDGNNLINTRSGKTTFSGTKTWKDEDKSDRPDSITVNLLQNGEIVASEEVTAKDDWKYSFKEVDEYDKNGVAWGYTIDEEPVDGYSKSVDGNDLINTRTGETEVSVTKTWKDDEDATGNRPDSITVNLLQNGVVFASGDVTSEDDWQYSFTHLPEYDDEGKAYKYSVTEHDVPGYASEVDGFEMINTRTDEKDIKITKTWLDTEESAKRPEGINIELFRSIADGEKKSVDTYEMTGSVNDKNWSLTIEDLPAFDGDGNAYTYEIEEEAVEGYETTINGFDITNLRVGDPGISGEKTWLDGDSEKRPERIKVILYQNGKQIDEVEAIAENNWKYSFTNLPSFDEKGAYYEYTVEEEPTPGYEALVDGYDIRNLRVGTTSVEGEKTWKNDQASDRPESITVQLLANGEVVDAMKITADSDWTYAFTDLDAYDAEGVKIEYNVEEKAVDGYETEINGHDITNTLIAEDSADSEKPGTSKDDEDKNGDKIDSSQDKPSDDGSDPDKDDGNTLPSTATDIFNYLLAGLLLIGLGMTAWILARRKKEA